MREHERETTGLLGCDSRYCYWHRRLELQKGPKIASMIVINGINQFLLCCSFVWESARSYFGLRGVKINNKWLG